MKADNMARNYHSVRAASAGAERLWVETSISRMRLKSVVARVTRRRTEHAIHGAAWSGGDRIAKIEFRIDDGGWREAGVTQDGQTPPQAGTTSSRARLTPAAASNRPKTNGVRSSRARADRRPRARPLSLLIVLAVTADSPQHHTGAPPPSQTRPPEPRKSLPHKILGRTLQPLHPEPTQRCLTCQYSSVG